ncbi:MAG: hypothetical protein L6Q38_16805, partial [Nitrospira sp.]|nr:hypothetical protein [Nitrospira sp.]
LPDVDQNTLIAAAQTYAQLADGPRLETTLGRLVQKAPDSAEAWYDYAGVLATLRKPDESMKALAKALEISDARRARDPKSKDLRGVARTDLRFQSVQNHSDWKRLVP